MQQVELAAAQHLHKPLSNCIKLSGNLFFTIPYRNQHNRSHLFRTAGTLWNASYQDWLALRCTVDTRLKRADHSSSNDDFCLGLFLLFSFTRNQHLLSCCACIAKNTQQKLFILQRLFFLLEGFFLLYLISTSTKELAASSFVQNV